jgi:HicB family
MDISPYVESLRRDLSAVAETAGPEARAVAERLVVALDPAVRLALVEALSHAAAEITSELPAGTVEVRLHGREPQFVVDVPAAPAPPTAPSPGGEPVDESDDGTVVRITLRIPEPLKAKAEELAGKNGTSLNSWIVNVLRFATRSLGVDPDADPAASFLGGNAFGRSRPGRRMTGWV